jgi:hypothetical protein
MKVVGADNSPPRYVFCVSLLSDVVYAVLFGPGAVLHATPYAVPSGLSRGPFASPERPLACPRPHDFLLSAYSNAHHFLRGGPSPFRGDPGLCLGRVLSAKHSAPAPSTEVQGYTQYKSCKCGKSSACFSVPSTRTPVRGGRHATYSSSASPARPPTYSAAALHHLASSRASLGCYPRLSPICCLLQSPPCPADWPAHPPKHSISSVTLGSRQGRRPRLPSLRGLPALYPPGLLRGHESPDSWQSLGRALPS